MENKSNTVFGKIKWFFTEIMKMYSSEKSYFSKKRVESGIAFAISLNKENRCTYCIRYVNLGRYRICRCWIYD